MTTPPHRLADRLQITHLYQLRLQDGIIEQTVTYAHAVALAQRGLIEGVGPKSGIVKSLRYLAASEIEQPEVRQPERADSGYPKSHPLNAKTELGAYRQSLDGGSVWSLCLLRGAGI